MHSPFETFVNHLRQNDWRFTIQEEGRVLRTQTDGENGRWPCIFTFSEDGKFAAYSSVLPCVVPPHRRQACAELVALINWGLCHGNFNVAPEDGEIYFYVSLPVFNGAMPQEGPDFLIGVTDSTTDEYFPAFMRLVYAGMSPAQALQEGAPEPKPAPRFETN